MEPRSQTSSLLSRLGISVPIIQAPMAGVQGSALTIAVTEAGGLGGLPCGLLGLDDIRAEVARIRTQTRGSFNLNFFCHQEPVADREKEESWRRALLPYYREYDLDPNDRPAVAHRRAFDESMAELLEELRPPVVSFHFGLPKPHLRERVRRLGATIMSSATTVEEAQWLEQQGVDIIIAQGLEAGGHRGMFLSTDLTRQMGTFALVPQVAASVRVPVVAAGGIGDASGVAAALALGASAVQLGTAYLLTHEAATSPVHRAALKSESSRHTAVTNVFTGRPARGIVNRVIAEVGPISELPPEFPLALGAIMPLRAAAEAKGKGDFSPLFAGQSASFCREANAAALTRDLARLVT